MNKITKLKVDLYKKLLKKAKVKVSLSEMQTLCALACDEDIHMATSHKQYKLKEIDLSITSKKITIKETNQELIKKC